MIFDLSTPLIDLLAREFGDIYDRATLARVALAFLVDPGQSVIGESIRRQGVIRTLEFVLRARDRTVGDGPARARVWHADLIASLTCSLENEFAILTPISPDWPKQLNAMGSTTPIALWAAGERSLMHARSMTITGNRTATTFGCTFASDLSGGLASRGWSICAGANYGIDQAAHKAALLVSGKTVAILASSLDVPFPSGNAALIERIFAEGLAISERAPGTSPTKWRFRRRNSLLGAFAEKTMIVEANLKSGALLAAEQAIALDRSVGVVPGHLAGYLNAGGLMLLREYDVALIKTIDEAEQF